MNYVGLLTLALGMGAAVYAQDVISAKAGLIHWIEGDVKLAGKTVVLKPAEFAEMKKGDELQALLGRAEVLLGPGIFLRAAENTTFRLISSSLDDTRLELTQGSILVEAGEFNPRHHGLIIKTGQDEIEVVKHGLYRIDAEPALLRVYDGVATVVAGGQTVTVKEGRQTALGPVPNPEKFDKERSDAFFRWAARRSSYIAVANLSAAKRLRDNGSAWGVGNWLFNPYFGSFTYIPMNGMYRSPFAFGYYSPLGFAYYSPYTVQRVYYRPPVRIDNPPSMGGGFDSGFGQRGSAGFGGRSSMGSYSAGGSAAPPPAAAAPAPAAGGRADGGGGGRSSGGGR